MLTHISYINFAHASENNAKYAKASLNIPFLHNQSAAFVR